MCILTVLIVHMHVYLCMYVGTNVVKTISSPSIMTSDTIFKSTTTPIDITTTAKPAVIHYTTATVLVVSTPNGAPSDSTGTANITVDNNNSGK